MLFHLDSNATTDVKPEMLSGVKTSTVVDFLCSQSYSKVFKSSSPVFFLEFNIQFNDPLDSLHVSLAGDDGELLKFYKSLVS